MLDVLLDALIDTAKTVPFLIAAYLLIGFIETKASTKIQNKLSRLGPLGPVGGAVLGIIPQCGLSVAAANFFASGMVTYGTIIAVFLSTSDEFIPILISHPEAFSYLWQMIVCKLVIAIVAGLSTDIIAMAIYKSYIRKMEKRQKELEAAGITVPACGNPDCTDTECGQEGVAEAHVCNDMGCGCGSGGKYNFFIEALIRTAQTTAFILAVNLVLGFAIYFIGEDTIGSILLNGTFFQPFVTALIGFIPNCAASVIITELFAQGALSFGSCVAGLCTGAGVGLAVLFKNNRRLKENLMIMSILYVVAVGSGLIIDLFIH